MKQFKVLALLSISISLLLSCGVSRKHIAVQNNPTAEPKEEITSPAIKKASDTDLTLEKIRNNIPDFNTLTIKFEANYVDTHNEQNFSGQIRIIKDSCIWISATKLGLEIARALFTKDSVYFVNRLSSDYGCFDYNIAKSFAGIEVNYEMVQAIFTARELLSFDKIYQYQAPNSLIFHNRKNETISISEQQIGYDTQSYKITSMALKDPKGRSFEVKYNNWETSVLIPQLLQILIQKPEVLMISLNYKQVMANVPVEMPFKIPKGASQWTPKF